MERNADGSLKVIGSFRDDWLHDGTDEFRVAKDEMMREVKRPLTEKEIEELRASTGSQDD